MIGTKAKSRQALERAIIKYQAKLAKAPNPTQRQYASQMLRMAEAALAKTTADEPVSEPDGDDVVDLRKDEYAAH